MTGRLVLAANNGELGGGEVMLLHLADAARGLGLDVAVVGPDAEAGVLDRAEASGHPVTRLSASRRRYLRELRDWDRAKGGRGDAVLWCNGLVPAAATTGHRGRVVHLHQEPLGLHRPLARLATRGALTTLVPSHSMAARVPRTRVLWNWTDDQPATRRPASDGVVTLGFLGRPSPDKGVTVLAEALAQLEREHPGGLSLLLAGEPHFVDERERDRVESAIAPVAHLVDRPGWLDRAAFFETIDLAVFPSVIAESFGLVAAEAMAARVPFVVSDAGALPEVAGPDHPWVARAGDAADLARVITAGTRATDGERTAYLDAARQRWHTHFSPDAGRARLHDLLTDLRLL